MTARNSGGFDVNVGTSRLQFEVERMLAAIDAAVTEQWTKCAEMAEDLAAGHAAAAAHEARS